VLLLGRNEGRRGQVAAPAPPKQVLLRVHPGQHLAAGLAKQSAGPLCLAKKCPMHRPASFRGHEPLGSPGSPDQAAHTDLGPRYVLGRPLGLCTLPTGAADIRDGGPGDTLSETS